MQIPITTIVAVPARLKSSRLPNKVLADIGGKPMLQRVLEQCALATKPISVVLCSDSEELLKLANNLGFPAILTSPDCQSVARFAKGVGSLLPVYCPRPQRCATHLRPGSGHVSW